MNVVSECQLLQRLQWDLDIHVNNQNRKDHSTYFPQSTEEEKMREVTGLASTLVATIKNLKQAHLDATTKFQAEVSHSQSNLVKVQAFTAELAEANKEVEAALTDTDSNFPSSDSHLTDAHGLPLSKT